jgi:hypothetical protein
VARRGARPAGKSIRGGHVHRLTLRALCFRLTASRNHAVINEPTVQTTLSNPKRRRLRFGMRSLIGFVLFLGLSFGWLGWVQRPVLEQEILVAELARDRAVEDTRPAFPSSLPTLRGLAL